MLYRDIDVNNYEKLMDEYGIHSLLAKIITSFQYDEHDLASFFYPLKEIHLDEQIFEPIKQKLLEIKEKKEKIFIFGDYDCDGLCSTAILVKVLQKLGFEHIKDFGYCIPDRIKEGYGLNMNRLQQAYDKGYRVLITVDNGVSALAELKWAKEHDMTVIVTDHHIISNKFDYDYLLHPSLFDRDYSYLCGAGVVYMLAEYLGLMDDSIKILAMMATISDVMCLKGINIKIVREGLKLLSEGKYPNITRLDYFSLPITEDDISFKVAPKLNAVGRLPEYGNVNKIVDFLLADNEKIIEEGAHQITEVNRARQDLSSEQYLQVKSYINKDSLFNSVCLEQLHDGLLGLIASRIAIETNKITFVFKKENGEIRGSARGIKGIDLMDLLNDFRSNLVQFGGHALACGLTMNEEQYQPFQDYLTERLCHLSTESITDVLSIDENDMSLDSLKEVYEYRPYGQERRIPYVRTKIRNIINYTSMKNNHQLKWVTNQLSFISFNNKGYEYYLGKDEIEVVGELRENNFRGNISYQILVKEILDK